MITVLLESDPDVLRISQKPDGIGWGYKRVPTLEHSREMLKYSRRGMRLLRMITELRIGLD